MDYFEMNDYLGYAVNVSTAGTYPVASAWPAPTAAPPCTVLGSINVGNTGGWQSWQTINANVSLPAVKQMLRLFAQTSTGCNVD